MKKSKRQVREGALGDLYDAYGSSAIESEQKNREKHSERTQEYAKQEFFTDFNRSLNAAISAGKVNSQASSDADSASSGERAFDSMASQLSGTPASAPGSAGSRAFSNMADQLGGGSASASSTASTSASSPAAPGTDYAAKRAAGAAAAQADLRPSTAPSTPRPPSAPSTAPSTTSMGRDPYGRVEPTMSAAPSAKTSYQPTAAAQRLAAMRGGGSRRLREMFEGRSLESGEIVANRAEIYHATKLLRESDLAWGDLELTLVEENNGFRIVSLESAHLWKKYNLFEEATTPSRGISISQWVPVFVKSYLARRKVAPLDPSDLEILGDLATAYQSSYGNQLKSNVELSKIWNLMLNHQYTSMPIRSQYDNSQAGHEQMGGSADEYINSMQQSLKSMPLDGSDNYAAAKKVLPELLAYIEGNDGRAMTEILHQYAKMKYKD